MTRTKAKAAETPPPTFEQTLVELERIVESLERGDLSLQDSLNAFERGVGLTRAARQALDSAEQRVRILTDSRVDGEPRPFDPDSGNSS